MLGRSNRLSVNIQRRPQGRMVQQLLHHLELGSNTSQQSRVRVSESMPSESGLNSNVLRRRTNVFAQDCLPPKRPPASVTATGENPVIRLCVTGAFPPLQQSVCEHGMNGHRFLR